MLKVKWGTISCQTLYEIVMCVQFHLESVGYMWKLLGYEAFVNLKFTLDNVMKER